MKFRLIGTLPSEGRRIRLGIALLGDDYRSLPAPYGYPLIATYFLAMAMRRTLTRHSSPAQGVTRKPPPAEAP